jgi:hypothetical protein
MERQDHSGLSLAKHKAARTVSEVVGHHESAAPTTTLALISVLQGLAPARERGLDLGIPRTDVDAAQLALAVGIDGNRGHDGRADQIYHLQARVIITVGESWTPAKTFLILRGYDSLGLVG